ncbi:MAG TPA: hypothetical protein VI913_03850 [Candidatus Peribacteraceae bacterium]|nr:hypothetical protein [Candidatus Peribacteraceae bacterium]
MNHSEQPTANKWYRLSDGLMDYNDGPIDQQEVIQVLTEDGKTREQIALILMQSENGPVTLQDRDGQFILETIPAPESVEIAA